MTVFHCSQMNSNRIFHLIPNRPSSVLWWEVTSHLEISFVHLHTCTLWYTTAFPQEGKTSHIHCHAFSLLHCGPLQRLFFSSLSSDFKFFKVGLLSSEGLCSQARLTWMLFFYSWVAKRKKWRADFLESRKVWNGYETFFFCLQWNTAPSQIWSWGRWCYTATCFKE